MCLNRRFKSEKISSNRWLWWCQRNCLFKSLFTGFWSLEFIIYGHQRSQFVHQFVHLQTILWWFQRTDDNMKERWCLCVQMSVFCMQEGGLLYLSALMNWLSCLITRRITHIFKIQSAKPGKAALGKSVLQVLNWWINQIEGSILCLCSGTFLCFEQHILSKFFFRRWRAGRWWNRGIIHRWKLSCYLS